VVRRDLADLENGVKICFDPAQGPAAHKYRSGDYWLIPARTAIEDVLWPGVPGNPQPAPPQGVFHHYAPLAVLSAMHDAEPTVVELLQRSFKSLAGLH
jgi:hypothetical protein